MNFNEAYFNRKRLEKYVDSCLQTDDKLRMKTVKIKHIGKEVSESSL